MEKRLDVFVELSLAYAEELNNKQFAFGIVISGGRVENNPMLTI